MPNFKALFIPEPCLLQGIVQSMGFIGELCLKEGIANVILHYDN